MAKKELKIEGDKYILSIKNKDIDKLIKVIYEFCIDNKVDANLLTIV